MFFKHMDWKNISDLLGRATKLFQSNFLLKKIIADSVKNVVGVTIPESDIVYKSGVIYIKTSPVIKSEILLNKLLIIDTVKKSGLVGQSVELK